MPRKKKKKAKLGLFSFGGAKKTIKKQKQTRKDIMDELFKDEKKKK
jgi:hypothetical protein